MPQETEQNDKPMGADLRSDNVMRVWRFFFLVVLLILFLGFLWKAVPVLLLLFAGVLVAVALRFISDQIARFTRLPPLVSLTLVLIVLIVGGLGGLALSAPAIAQQFQDLSGNLKDSMTNLREWLEESETGSFLEDWLTDMNENGGPNIWAGVAGAFTTTFGAIAGFLLTLIVGIFLAYTPALYIGGFIRLIPLQRRDRASEIVRELGNTLRWWMAGQLISMIVLAVTTWLMLYLLGVPLAALLGVLTGVLTFIPYLGPLIALIPILLVAFAEGPSLMITVLALYLVIQNAEANVLMPIIFKRTVHLPPVLTIIAQILLGAIFGFVGIVLATPLMAVGMLLTRMIYVEDILGDSMDRPIRSTQ